MKDSRPHVKKAILGLLAGLEDLLGSYPSSQALVIIFTENLIFDIHRHLSTWIFNERILSSKKLRETELSVNFRKPVDLVFQNPK